MESAQWLQHLRERHEQVQAVFPPAPALSPEEIEWAAVGAPAPVSVLPTLDDVQQPYTGDPSARLPWHAPVWDAGATGTGFAPGLPSKDLPFWDQFILHEHPQRDQFLSFLADGVGLHDTSYVVAPVPWALRRPTV